MVKIGLLAFGIFLLALIVVDVFMIVSLVKTGDERRQMIVWKASTFTLLVTVGSLLLDVAESIIKVESMLINPFVKLNQNRVDNIRAACYVIYSVSVCLTSRPLQELIVPAQIFDYFTLLRTAIFAIKAKGFHDICATSLTILCINNFTEVVIGIDINNCFAIVVGISNLRSGISHQTN